MLCEGLYGELQRIPQEISDILSYTDECQEDVLMLRPTPSTERNALWNFLAAVTSSSLQ